MQRIQRANRVLNSVYPELWYYTSVPIKMRNNVFLPVGFWKEPFKGELLCSENRKSVPLQLESMGFSIREILLILKAIESRENDVAGCWPILCIPDEPVSRAIDLLARCSLA